MSGPSFGPDAFPEPSESMRAAGREWLVRCDRGLTPAEKAEFHRWLAADPLHAVAWEEGANLLEHMDRLTVSRALIRDPSIRVRRWRWIPALAITAAVLAVALIVGFRQTPNQPSPVTPPAAPGSAAAATRDVVAPAGNAVVSSGAVSIAVPAVPSDRSRSAGTVTDGQLRRLSDGTVVFLKPGAEFYERFTEKYRAVNLVQGEAMFDVAPTDSRLFVMTAGVRATSGEVAVATTEGWFDVAVHDGIVETKVITGRVKVSPAQLLVAASREGSEYNGTITEAGLIARIEYPSKVDSDIHVLPLAPSEITELMAWKRSVETATLPVSLPAK